MHTNPVALVAIASNPFPSDSLTNRLLSLPRHHTQEPGFSMENVASLLQALQGGMRMWSEEERGLWAGV